METMHPLLQHIQRMSNQVPADAAGILSFFEEKTFAKKALLQEEGKVCRDYFFVVKGCLRLYFNDDRGMEHTQQFALENWWMTDLTAFRSGGRSTYFIQALEPTEVMCLDAKRYDALLERHPAMEKYFRLMYERAYAATLMRTQMITRMPKPAFFELFESRHPEFMQRVPQKVLASFLGITPEYLSELRRTRVGQKPG